MVECDLATGELVRNGDRQRLEPRLAGVLGLLVQRAGLPVTRDEFLETVWDEDGSDEALNQAISRLRRLLGDARLIATLPRVGYRLTVEPEPLPEMPSPGRGHQVSRFAAMVRRHALMAGFAAGAVCAGAIVAIVVRLQPPPASDVEIELVPEVSGDREFHVMPSGS